MSPPQRNILVLSFVDLINIQIEEEEAKIHYNRLNIHRSARAHVARAKMFFSSTTGDSVEIVTS